MTSPAFRTPRLADAPCPDGAPTGRRRVLRLLQEALLVPLGAGAFGVVATGCATIAGDQDLDAYFKLKPNKNGDFFGWSEITVEGADPSEDDARLKKVFLETLDGDDLTFVTSVIAEAVVGEERTLLAQGTKFPKGETIAPLEIVHTGGLAEFFPDGQTIRIEWTGTADPTYPYPADGMRVNVGIQVEVL